MPIVCMCSPHCLEKKDVSNSIIFCLGSENMSWIKSRALYTKY